MGTDKKAVFLTVSLIFALFFSLQSSNASITVSQSFVTQGQISSGQIYWSANFDNGNFNEITSNSGGEVQSNSGATSILETTNVFSGSYSVKNSVDKPPSSGIIHTKLIRWTVIQDTPQFYFGAALYIPNTFTVSTSSGANWCNIMQMHCKSDSANGLPACIILSNVGGIIKMSLYQKDLNNVEHTYWTANAPLGQWFRVVIYAEFKQNGNLTMWLSTDRDGAMTNSNRVFSGIADLRTGDSFAGPFVDTGIYQDYRSPAQYTLSDSMIVASTLSLATPQE
jgi:hypothetical protein